MRAAAMKSYAILLSALLAATPAFAQVVGKAAAVNADSTVSGRTLTIGAAVVHKERIKTNASGSLQLLFIDRTTLTVGPNSDIMIDEYVFDPNKSVGKMTVSVSKGLMRFVGGQISHNGEATVKTPPATIGIRGGVAIIEVNGGKTTATNVFGNLTVTPNAGPSAGAPANVPQGQTGTAGISVPVTTAPTSQQQFNSTNQQLQSKSTQTGGVSTGTSSQAASVSTTTPSTTAAITPASPPASGSTAAGPSSASGSTSASSNTTSGSFAGGTPPAVTTTSQASQTSSSNTAATQSPPPSGPPPKCCT
jgi:hypothetical protein